MTPHEGGLASNGPWHQRTDPSRLAPEDAIYLSSPPRRRSSPLGTGADGIPERASEGRRRKRGHSGSRQRKGAWKKLLWVRQSYPDNYTDENTFLDHLQRNPRLQPYEFWRLMGDSTVIVQHVSSVIVFVCCFTAIFHNRVSPYTVVGCGSLTTLLGWVVWDFWVGQEEESGKLDGENATDAADGDGESHYWASSSTASSAMASGKTSASGSFTSGHGGVSTAKGTAASQTNAAATAGANIPKAGTATTPVAELVNGHPTGAPTFARPETSSSPSSLSPMMQRRLSTLKSALLIYCTVLGLSPILKSLTQSTSSDSIWAMSAWLMIINVFFFDYGGGVGAKFPASLSTNAALMASTVLASRLTSTTHVFSLTLFSIEVFGLFPVFRRHLRHVSWTGHIALTALLVVGAGAGVGVTISAGAWTAAVAGAVLGSILTVLAMGICSWWLIDLQKYKNEIHGPWDPARPIIRRRWD